jgi:hypothetical protein
MYDFLADIAYLPHGGIHMLLGGMSGNTWMEVLAANGESEADYANLYYYLYNIQKPLWRDGLYTCPDYCDASTPASECRCSCDHLPEFIEQEYQGDYQAWVIELFLYVGVIGGDQSQDFSASDLVNDYDGSDISQVWAELICNTYDDTMASIPGDLLSSSAAADPVFWVAHPTTERVWMWKQLVGGFEDTTWPDTGVSWGVNADLCDGHFADSHLPCEVYIGNSEPPVSTLTNVDFLYKVADPNHDVLPYIYDHFSWDHCAQDGFSADLKTAAV